MEQLIQKLKLLKSINPDSDYAHRAKILILSGKPTMAKQPFFSWPMALALSGVTVVLIMGLLIGNKNQDATARNNKGVRVGETRYYQKTINDISEVTVRLQDKINEIIEKIIF